TQSPSVSVTLGHTDTITCSGDVQPKQYTSWYQQNLGKNPVHVIYKDSEQPSGIPEIFSESSSGTMATKIIDRTQVKDEAITFSHGIVIVLTLQ
ncbi:Ig lambda chain V-IV region Bau, partial [Sciurus carolinensis]|nr:Ig lambda chain V-IV region Bau [Sciurus carolinensis]